MNKKTSPNKPGSLGTVNVQMDLWTPFFAPQARMAEAMIGLNIEMLDFLRARFERDRAMLADLANASDPAEAARMWQDFWGRMFIDYSAETTKLAATAGEIAETALRTATEEGAALLAKTGKTEA